MQFNKALLYNIALKSINIVILFVINILFVRIAGAKVTGDFFYLITILSFITLIISGSLESGITFYASKNTSGPLSFAWLIILICILQLALTFVIIFSIVKNPTSLSLLYLLMFVISNILISNFSAIYISYQWFVSVNIILLIANSITLLFLLLILNQQTVTAIDNAEKVYLLSFFLQSAGLTIFFFIKNKIRRWNFPRYAVVKQILKYSLLAFIGNICFFLVTRLDYVFVKTYCSSQALGNYVQISKIGQMFVLIPAMAASVIFPFTVTNKNILAKVQWLCRFMTVVIVLAAVFIIVTGKWLFPWFFGKEFYLMYTAMLFFLPGIFALCISSLLASHISGKGFISINVTASVIALIIVIAGDIIFIPKYGINAAAAVSSIAYLSCMLYLLRHSIVKYNSKIEDYFQISFTEFKYVFLHITNKNKK